jgi:hypothetical protein
MHRSSRPLLYIFALLAGLSKGNAGVDSGDFRVLVVIKCNRKGGSCAAWLS